MLADTAVDDDREVDLLRLPGRWMRGVDLAGDGVFVDPEMERVGNPSMRDQAKPMGSGGNRRVHGEVRRHSKEGVRFLLGRRACRFTPLKLLDFADLSLQAGGTEDNRIGAVQRFPPDLEFDPGSLLPAGRKDRDQRRLGKGLIAGGLRLESARGRNEPQQRDTGHPEEKRTESGEPGTVAVLPAFHHSELSGC